MKHRYNISVSPSLLLLLLSAFALVLSVGCDTATTVLRSGAGLDTGDSSGAPPVSVAGDWQVHNLNTIYESGVTRIYTFAESGELDSRTQIEPGRTYTDDFSTGTVTDSYSGGDTFSGPNVLIYARTTWADQTVTIEIFNKLDNQVHERYRLDLSSDHTVLSGTLETPVNGPGKSAFVLIRL